MIAVDDGQHIGNIGEKPLVDGWFCHEVLSSFFGKTCKRIDTKKALVL
jgi:hypothetical protein